MRVGRKSSGGVSVWGMGRGMRVGGEMNRGKCDGGVREVEWGEPGIGREVVTHAHSLCGAVSTTWILGVVTRSFTCGRNLRTGFFV